MHFICLDCFEIWIDTNFAYGDIRNSKQATISDCVNFCRETEGCIGFSYINGDGWDPR